MKEQEIIEGNRLIAEFMGVPEFMPKTTHPNVMIFNMTAPAVESLKYHTSWDWLMPVVEKIESIHHVIDGKYINVRISQGYVQIEGGIERIFFNTSIEGSKIITLWKAILSFIKWYNTQSIPIPQ